MERHTLPGFGYGVHLGCHGSDGLQFASRAKWMEMMCVMWVHCSKKLLWNNSRISYGRILHEAQTLPKVCVFLICVFVMRGIRGAA